MTTTGSKTFKGYGCEVQWDGTTLKARGTNKNTHFALLGGTHIDPDKSATSVAAAAWEESPGSTVEGLKAVAIAAATDVKAIFTPPEYLILTKDQITIEEYNGKPNLFVNGKLVIRETATGRKHEFHFMKKHQADFDQLVKDLS
jgi:hypothetical protein